jgi:2-Cys peroxiredoxin 5
MRGPRSSHPQPHPLPPGAVDLGDFTKGRKVVLLGVPGAFTPGCSATHLPGFVAAADAIKAKGVAEIACLSVNDPFVMAAWGTAQKADGKVRMFADTNGELARALGVSLEVPVLGGTRMKRFSAIVEDGTITALNIEPEQAPTGMTCSLADPLLKQL